MPYTSAVVDRLHLVRWLDPVMADVEPLVKEVVRAREQIGSPLFGIAIVPIECPPPTDEVRAVWTKRVGRLLDAAESLHFVIEGSGFRLTIMRSALTTITFFSTHRGRVQVHSTVNQALWRLEPSLTMPIPRILELVQTKLAVRGDLLKEE
jgi:hypothetical protein